MYQESIYQDYSTSEGSCQDLSLSRVRGEWVGISEGRIRSMHTGLNQTYARGCVIHDGGALQNQMRSLLSLPS